MLKSVYVIDIIVRDLDRAIEFFRAVLGVEPVDTSEIGADQSELRAAHFPAPGPGREGIHSIGLFALTTDDPKTESGKHVKEFLETHGEGISLIGFQVDDIDATQRDLEGKGLRFINDRPVDYQMGRGNQLEPRFGTSVWFAQHDEDGYDKFMAMVAASRAGAAGR
ncbi:MAG TPA: VOC family protein [Myxococcota bacterium]|nr:VOC family protein [Myxococcota bacterium]